MAGHPTLWPAPPLDTPGWVYVMARRAPCGTLYKIGYSTRPRERARELGARIVALTPGTPGLERQYHRWFRRERLPGTEWFVVSDRIVAFTEDAGWDCA